VLLMPADVRRSFIIPILVKRRRYDILIEPLCNVSLFVQIVSIFNQCVSTAAKISRPRSGQPSQYHNVHIFME